MAAASGTDRPTIGAPLVIAGERGSGRSAAAIAAAGLAPPGLATAGTAPAGIAAPGSGRRIHVVHGLETRRGPACWAAVLGDEPAATPDARTIAAAVGDGVLVVDDADLLAAPDRAVLHELAQHAALVVVVAATDAGRLAIDLAAAPTWTPWPDAVAEPDAVLDSLSPDERTWLATWAALAAALATTTVTTALVGEPPEPLVGAGRAVVVDGSVSVWPALARLAAAVPDVAPASELLAALATRTSDDALASDLLHAAGDVAGSSAAARRALDGSVSGAASADRRARLLVRVADTGAADDARRACDALVRRELVHEHLALLDGPASSEPAGAGPIGDAGRRIAVLRQLDREHDRWRAWVTSSADGASPDPRERLTLVCQTGACQAEARPDTAAGTAVDLDAVDPESCDDLDGVRLRWSLAVLGSAAEADAAAVDRAATNARRFGSERPAWARTADDLGAIVAFHRHGDLDATTGLLDAGATPRLPLAVRQAHRVLALADAGRTTEALTLLDVVLDGPSPTTRALRRWCRIEVELAAGRVVTALRVADESPLRPGEPIDRLALVAHAWAAHDAGEVLPVDDDVASWPALRPTTLEVEAVRRWRADGPDAAVGERFAGAAAAWSGRHLRGELRCRWAAAEVARLAGDTDGSVRALRDLDRRVVAAGALPLLARVRQSLRRAGVRAATPRPAADRSAVGGPLSPREREVLLLAGKGLTARAIAQQLGIGVATVETQITSAMVKLGARTRVQAALMIAEGRA